VPKQERLLRKGPEVIVATPGRLWEGLRCHWPGVSDVRRLSWLVLDEADRMVQQGHYQVGPTWYPCENWKLFLNRTVADVRAQSTALGVICEAQRGAGLVG
jgi:DEAD/DEAH box helicase